MNPISRRTVMTVGASALFAVGTASFLAACGHSSEKPLPAPALSKTASAKLKVIDDELGFFLARLASAEADGARIARVADQWVKRGKFTGDGADFDSALLLLEKGDKLQSRFDPRIGGGHAHALWARHRFLECRAEAEKDLKISPEDSDLQGLAADCAEYSGDTAAGEAGFRKMLEDNSRQSIPYIGLAYHFEIAGDLEQALDLLNKALNATYPQPLGYERQAYVHSVLGDVYAKQGDIKNAKLQYRWALSKKPDYAQALNGLVDVAQWEGNDDEAEKGLRDLIDSESPTADYELKLADLLDRHGKKEEAATVRKKAETFYEWSVSTGYDGYLRPLAGMKLAEGDFKRAAELALRDIEIRPTTESKAIYQNVLNQAKNAGKPIDESTLKKIVSKPIQDAPKS